MKFSGIIIGICCMAIILAGATPRYVEFELRNDSSRPRSIRVRDTQCSGRLSEKCRLAKDVIRSADCSSTNSSTKCKRARRILARDECETGTIYSGNLKPGKTLHLSSCNDGSGHADIEISVEGGAWTHYSWIDAGDTVKFR